MMVRKEDARPAVGAAERAVENGTASQTAHASTHDSTTAAGGRQPFRIADLLRPGAENAVTRRQLMALTGMSDRELRRLIEAERRQGCPILSDNIHGYFLPGDSAEKARCVRSLRYRAREIQRTADAIEGGK